MEKVKNSRKSIPQNIVNQVMKEFSSICAMCDKTDPQLHHIDEEPSNNDPQNLIPLCTDCHLIKIHKKSIYPREIIKLFRVHKSKLILSVKFLPIYKRMKFLLVSDINSYDSKELRDEYDDLISFISAMKMGDIYSKRIKDILFFPAEYCVAVVHYQPDPDYDRLVGTSRSYPSESSTKGSSLKEFKKMYQENNDKIIELIIEQLVYQDWE